MKDTDINKTKYKYNNFNKLNINRKNAAKKYFSN